MSRSSCPACKQEGNGQVPRPKHQSPVCPVQVGSWGSCDSRGDRAALGLGGCGHPGDGWRLGLLGDVLARGAPGRPVAAPSPSYCLPLPRCLPGTVTGSLSSPEGSACDPEESLDGLKPRSFQSYFSFCFFSVRRPGAGAGGRGGDAGLRNRPACASSRPRVPFVEEVRGVRFGHAAQLGCRIETRATPREVSSRPCGG